MIIRLATVSDARRLAELHIGSFRTALRGLVLDDFLDRLSLDRFHKGWTDNLTYDPGEVIVAEDETGIVQGYSCAGRCSSEPSPPATYEGEIHGLVVSEAEQGRGIGFLLMQATFDRLAALQCANTLLWTFEGNLGASRFFERAGGRIIDRRMKNFGGRDLVEIAYGWDSLKPPLRTML